MAIDYEALEATRTLYEQVSKVARQGPPSTTPTGASASTLYSALWPVAIVAFAFVTMFLWLRPVPSSLPRCSLFNVLT